MDIGGAVKVEYWAIREGATGLIDPEGIAEFRAELTKSYIGQVHARPGALGGLYGLTVEFVTGFSLHHFLNLILDGVAYDLIKSGSDALVLRPFLAAYNALKQKNAERSSRIHVDRLLLSFQDSVVVINSLRNDSIVRNLESLLQALAANYSHLILRTGERPFSINIPVVEDPAEDRLCRFREFLDFDETIQDIKDERYFDLWGVQYDYAGTTRVYDVAKRVLLDEEFYTQSRHWQAWEDRRKRNSAPQGRGSS